MADTLGGVIDKLLTADLKMSRQEILNEVYEMNFEDFKSKFGSEDGLKELWRSLKKCSDLNVQKDQLIEEIDDKINEMIKVAKSGNSLDNGKYIQRAHKTY